MTLEVDSALLEMFAAEVETHMAALNDGLLALEQNPNESGRSEALMRAAHSIKGAARLVGLQAAVDVAHVIEDAFVAAREGRLALTSSLVDVLLAGVDLLGRVAQFDVPADARVSPEQVTATVQRIKQASTTQPQTVAAPVALAPSHSPAPQLAAVAEDRLRTFKLAGDLDEVWANHMHSEVNAALESGTAIDFDLSGTTEISPIGLALLAATARIAESGRLAVRFTNIPQPFEQLLRSVGLEPSIHVTGMGS